MVMLTIVYHHGPYWNYQRNGFTIKPEHHIPSEGYEEDSFPMKA